MSAAQLNMLEPEHTGSAALKQQVAERLAAHRSRRTRSLASAHQDATPLPSRSAAVAAAVAERYAQTQTYRAFLAAEAENALREAATAHAAAAAAATRNAEAAARLLEELAALPLPESKPALISVATPVAVPVTQVSAAGFTVRLYENLGEDLGATTEPHKRLARIAETPDEARALDDEIAYRQSPTFELDRPSIPIPGNLLAFPRQLVASRKARPRYAEGPLREDNAHDQAQLRIFEVEATQIAAAPAADSASPEWSSIWLDALAKEASPETVEEAAFALAQRPKTATLGRRALAAAVDAAIIAAAFAAFATLFRFLAPGQTPPPALAALASVVTLFLFFLFYQALCFTFANATPGMRCARIGLCTFTDENPSRAAMRRRIFALLLAACPLGIGILWACLDDDRLGWHDRISRMYPRSY